jgi:hypothetical protein
MNLKLFLGLYFFIGPAFQIVAADQKTPVGEVNFASFVKSEWQSFVGDAPPTNCKEVEKKNKKNPVSYAACIVAKKPFYIRLSYEGTPMGVIKFRNGLAVQYEGVENPDVKLLKAGKVVAIFNESSKRVQTKFTTPEEKEFNQIAEGEVSLALAAFGLKP